VRVSVRYPAPDPDLWLTDRSDQQVVTAVEAAQASAAGHPRVGPYGLPAELFGRLWSIDDICAFCGVETTKARQLMSTDGAPPKMRMASARCDRWNPVQVVTWLHGDDWRVTTTHEQTANDGPSRAHDPRRFPGDAWLPGGVA
jgi:hypothetical protein